MMMAAGFAIGGDMDQLGVVAAIGKAIHQTVGELLSAAEQLLEGHGLGNWAVVKEDGDASP